MAASGMEAETGSMGRRKSSSRDRNRRLQSSPSKVPVLIESDMTFKDVQKRRVKVMEKRYDEEIRKRRKEFDKECDRMREDFLKLYPDDKDWDSEELISDPMILRRRGSMDILDQKTVPTLVSDFFEVSGSRFKVMFDVAEFDPDSIEVQIQSDLIKVSATMVTECDDGSRSEQAYSRKVQRPLEISANRFETSLTQDGILTVDAPFPVHHQPPIQRISAPNSSPSHSVHSNPSTRSQSPTSPQTPTGPPKMGMPMFTGKPGERRMSLVVEIGDCFKPSDILVQVCNSTTLEIKAKTEERTTERMSKNKYFKLVELSEKIVATSLRAGLMNDGKLVIGALGKPEKGADGKPVEVPVTDEGGGGSDSVVDLAADFSRVMNPEPPPKEDAM